MVETTEKIEWSHQSVRRFANKADPIETMIAHARSVVLNAQEQGWTGPPFDPVALAEILHVNVEPKQNLLDARTVSGPEGALRIEFNPDQPKGRQRYSIAHELAHTFFPDVREEVRHRLSRREMRDDDWQLELLCNLGAAEILMPIGSFVELSKEELSAHRLMELRRKFDVSIEALCIRLVRLTEQPCAMFAAACHKDESRRYKVDYSLNSRTFRLPSLTGTSLPQRTICAECIAIGYTAKGREKWQGVPEAIDIECVGIPPYPGDSLPRVVGFMRPVVPEEIGTSKIEHLRGDATQPRGSGKKIVAHVVNDKTPNWGGGFASVVRSKWPDVQTDFRDWVSSDPTRLELGKSRLFWVDDEIGVFSMVSQHGYGPSPRPRIRYAALSAALKSLGDAALSENASIHMPTIGCGQAGGRWSVVKELIDESLCQRRVCVTVYELANQPAIEHSGEAQLF
ncbi:MAG: ImmA/IrrE family metallo-endopeptidase [Nitrospiraceae bacterium]|nr:ImmA/IrrE family metallo-endopeptidase [Nitrospiraceae bacterium]